MKIPKSFFTVDFASSPGRVDVLSRDACKFMRRLASDLRLPESDFTIHSGEQVGSPAFVALQTVSLYVEVKDASHRDGIVIVYRTCRGRDDHAGGADNYVSFAQLMSEPGYQSFVSDLRFVAGLRFGQSCHAA
jgi:hypothetical protein